ncbi:unannotated protein [freshwater metagenome]|uniref:Unannotated protein n=1 Tax=freshwater metagenome TaxID=449393 RepID=A0A6J6VNP1_9ZZZZ
MQEAFANRKRRVVVGQAGEAAWAGDGDAHGSSLGDEATAHELGDGTLGPWRSARFERGPHAQTHEPQHFFDDVDVGELLAQDRIVVHTGGLRRLDQHIRAA